MVVGKNPASSECKSYAGVKLKRMNQSPIAGFTEYELHHLPSHLEESSRGSDLHKLLRLEFRAESHAADLTDSSRVQQHSQSENETTPSLFNAWYSAHETLGEISVFLSDIARARRLAEMASASELEAFDQAPSIGLEVRYSLIRASISSLAENLPSNLILALVQKGIWSISRGLTFARQIPEPEEKVETLMKLALQMAGPKREEVLMESLGLARSISSSESTARALTLVLPHFSPPLADEILTRALEAARVTGQSKRDGEDPALTRLNQVLKLLPFVAEHERKEVLLGELNVVKGLSDGKSRVKLLALLVPYLGEEVQIELEVQTMNAYDKRVLNETDINEIADIASSLFPEYIREFAFRAKDLSYNTHHSSRFTNSCWVTRLAINLKEPSKTQVIQEELHDVLSAYKHERIKGLYSGDFALALIEMIPHLEGVSKGQAVHEAVKAMKKALDPKDSLKLFSRLMPLRAQLGVYEDFMKLIRSINSHDLRLQAIKESIAYLREPLKTKALEEALRTAIRVKGTADRRVLWLVDLVPHMSSDLKHEALRNACEIASTVKDVPTKKMLLRELAPHLCARLLREVDKQQTINDKTALTRLVDVLAPHLPPGNRALDNNSRDKESALVKPTQRSDFVKLLRASAALLRSLITRKKRMNPYRPLERRDPYVLRTKALSELADQLPQSWKRKVLILAARTARKVEDGDEQIGLVGEALLPRLPEAERNLFLKELLEHFSLLRDYDYNNSIDRLAYDTIDESPFFQGAVRARALRDLAPHLPNPMTSEALSLASSLSESFPWVVPLVTPYVSEPLKSMALQTSAEKLIEKPDTSGKVNYLTQVAIQLGEPLRNEILRQALDVIPRLSQEDDRADSLATIAKHLPDSLVHRALDVARDIKDEKERGRAMGALISHLPEETQAEALVTALQGAAIKERFVLGHEFDEVVSHLLKLTPKQAYMHWGRILALLSSYSRKDLLTTLRALQPLIIHIGGPQTAREMVSSIEDVGRWWL